MEEKVIAYKGFDKDLTCRGFQYEIGKEYKEKEVEVCKSGFHACENPLDVLCYYDDIIHDRFCVVEQSGIIDKSGRKQGSSKIKIVAEIGFMGLFKAGIEWIKKITDPRPIVDKTREKNDKNKIGTSRNHVRIGSSDCSAQIGVSGIGAQIGSSGNYARIEANGDVVQIGSSGRLARIGANGDCAQIGSSGNYARIAANGDCAQIGSNEEFVKIGVSGTGALIGASGGYAQIASNGDSVQIGSSGRSARIGTNGDCSRVESTGKNSVICCAGNNSAVRAKKGSWITLSEWGYSKDKKSWVPICVRTEYVDGERIKANTWYKLQAGKFVEVE